MNQTALVLYGVAGAADVASLLLAGRHLRSRLAAISATLPPEPQTPMSYNTAMTTVDTLLAARTSAMVDVHVREGFNELIRAIRAETDARSASDARMAILLDAPDRARDLLLASTLLTVGVLLGLAGNVVGAAS